MRDRKLNISNQNERSFRKKNSKVYNSKIISSNNNNNDPDLHSTYNNKAINNKNSNFKNELKNFLEENNNLESINKSILFGLEKQKIIEINEEDDEKSFDANLNDYNKTAKDDLDTNLNQNENENKSNNIKKEEITNKKISKDSHKNPIEKFENLYLQRKSESNNKKIFMSKDNIKYGKDSQQVINRIKNDDELSANKDNFIISSNKVDKFEIPNLDKEKTDENIDSDLDEQEENESFNDKNNFQENGEIEEIFNNFEQKDQKYNENQGEHLIYSAEMNKMEKDELIKYILNSDLLKENDIGNKKGDSYKNPDDGNFEEEFLLKNDDNNLNNGKNKFSFAPRIKNNENNQNELMDNILKNVNNSDALNKKLIQRNELAVREKALSHKKNISQLKKAKENPVNKYNSKLTNYAKNKDEANKMDNIAKKNNINNSNNEKKNGIVSKNKETANKKSEESIENSNPLFNNIENIEKNYENDNYSEGILNEIEKRKDELNSKQILEMLLYNKTELENEINQVFNIYFIY
jgi:hypothetical protein